MKHTIFAATVLTAFCMSAPAAVEAATFSGYSKTSDVFFDADATFDYDPSILGGAIFDPTFSLDIGLAPGLGTGTLTLLDALFATILDGSLVDTKLVVDNGTDDDKFSMLFDLSVGATAYAIAEFTGDLDGLGFSDFFTDGVFLVDGNLKITGAIADDTAVIPLPASALLLLGALAGLGAIQRNRRTG